MDKLGNETLTATALI